jgi:hypothetical protein
MVSTSPRLLNIFGNILNLDQIDSTIKESLEKISDENLLKLNRIFFPYFKNNPNSNSLFLTFWKSVSFGSRSIGEWIIALDKLSDYLKNNNLNMKFEDFIEYSSCYFEAQSTESIEIFIDLYGIERACSKNN